MSIGCRYTWGVGQGVQNQSKQYDEVNRYHEIPNEHLQKRICLKSEIFMQEENIVSIKSQKSAHSSPS